MWQTALVRRVSDPDGAITSARTLLETVCKHILDDVGVDYDAGADLPKLYGLTAKAVSIAPSQQTEPILKQILGGCTAVVEGLGALRNKLGDADTSASCTGRRTAACVSVMCGGSPPAETLGLGVMLSSSEAWR